MSSDVTANSRTVVHKGDGIVNVSALPDVCKTPTPAGPTPVPYPNVARSSDLADGAKHVTIEGNPVALENSKLKQSSGDEAGTLGGVVSGKNRGKMTWGTSSPDVCVEGKGVIRFADLTHHNCNSYNVFEMQKGARAKEDVIHYGDDEKCPLCGLEPPKHPILSDEEKCADEMSKLFSKLKLGMMHDVQWVKDSFMVGVLVCDCGVVFSAASGYAKHPSPPPFIIIARKLGHKTEDDWSPKGEDGLVWKTLLEKKKTKAVEQDLKRRRSKKEEIKKWLQGRIQPPECKTLIGQCAAPRVISLAICLGHRPAFMCERWFSRSNDTTSQNYELRIFNNVKEGERPHALFPVEASIKKIEKTFAHGENVPSCDLCKRQVPALLCAELPKCTSRASR